MYSKALESVTEDHNGKRVLGGSRGVSNWRSSESIWYLMGMNDPGSKEKVVWQIETFEDERKWGL